MFRISRILLPLGLVLVLLTTGAHAAHAKGNEFEAIVNHLKSKYQAKKVNLHLMWLARLAVKVVRPAGLKSFDVTLFEDLKFSPESLDGEMRSAMRNSFGTDWSPILRVRSRDGERVYMYMREDGKNVKIALVTIDKKQAAVVRATFSPEKLLEFINNPRIFGISFGDGANSAQIYPEPTEKDSIPATNP